MNEKIKEMKLRTRRPQVVEGKSHAESLFSNFWLLFYFPKHAYIKTTIPGKISGTK